MTALHYSTLHNTAEVARLLLQSGAKTDCTNCDGNTPLHLACQNGQIQVVNNVQYFDKADEKNLLIYFALLLQISLLLYYRANPRLKNKQSATPFDCACEYGRTKAVEILLQSGLYKNVECNNRATVNPLHLAAKNGHVEILKLEYFLRIQNSWMMTMSLFLESCWKQDSRSIVMYSREQHYTMRLLIVDLKQSNFCFR